MLKNLRCQGVYDDVVKMCWLEEWRQLYIYHAKVHKQEFYLSGSKYLRSLCNYEPMTKLV